MKRPKFPNQIYVQREDTGMLVFIDSSLTNLLNPQFTAIQYLKGFLAK